LTEVPDHLLQRSRDRRSALGLGGDDGDAAPAAAAEASTAVESATLAAPAKAAAVVVEATPKQPAFIPPYVEASERRQRIPMWALPVLAFLPVWAVIYAQSLSAAPATSKTELLAGADVYNAKGCAGCHGATGGGGTGRKFADGEVIKTFPNIAYQLQYVRLGDAGLNLAPYGDPKREGGQHVGPYNGVQMPAFKDLTDKELLEVVRHERETIAKEPEARFTVSATGAREWSAGKPMLDATGKLIWPDGTPMFDAAGKLTQEPDPSAPPVP
jgi:mono/diheme cytochrome c family protein